MTEVIYQKLIKILNEAIHPITKNTTTYDLLLKQIGDARIVLIGEATHGTHEFYQTRINITRQLIEKKGFMAVAIEGDWPDAYRIHRYITGKTTKTNCHDALADFKRFPTWMWRNTTIPPFLTWLRSHNDKILNPLHKVGFYGLDLYSMYSSMQAVIDYLATVDPEAASRARHRYACFDHLKADPQTYGYLTTAGMKKSCVKEAVDQLLELQHHALDYIKKDGVKAEEDYFTATQNARLVKNAENYYRSMFEGRVSSWNVRDQHMTETLNILANHLEEHYQRPAKIIVWAHNSHVGDARATEMSSQQEINIGQLVREQYGNEAYSIGFSTYKGTVTAASEWDGPAECKNVNPGIEGSYEELFHHLDHDDFLLNLRNNPTLEHYFHLPILQRAIGVIYRPDTERMSHYFLTRLAYQFDSIIHLDKTTAVRPLDE